MIAIVIISALLGFISALMFGIFCEKENHTKIRNTPGILVSLGLSGGFLLFSFFTFYDLAYKDGQVDAALGKQKYHLTTQPDKTLKWELKKELLKGNKNG